MRSRPLDGLRAVAALSVFATHAAALTGFTSRSAAGHVTARLNVGVALFFVLSGFLLYRPWVAARLGGRPAPSVRGYAVRRILRILPAYWIALLVLGLVASETVPGALGDKWWVYFGLAQVYDASTVTKGIAPAWSLGIEATFYVLLPILAWLAARALSGRRDAVRIELIGLVVSAGLAVVLPYWVTNGRFPTTLVTALPSRWPWFAAGLALAVLSGSPRRPSITRWHWWWLLAAAAFAVSIAVLPQEIFTMTKGDQRVELVLYTVIAGSLAAPLVLGRPGDLPSRLLGTRAAVAVGTISYGVFLWHHPVLEWLQAHVGDHGAALVTALGLGSSLLLGLLSWQLVERPLMRLGSRSRSRPDRDAEPGAPLLEPAP